MALTETEAKVGTEKLDRRERYKVIRFRMGLCITCGDPRGDSPHLRVCASCGSRKARSKRKKLGFSKWKEGGPGRIPLFKSSELKEN